MTATAEVKQRGRPPRHTGTRMRRAQHAMQLLLEALAGWVPTNDNAQGVALGAEEHASTNTATNGGNSHPRKLQP